MSESKIIPLGLNFPDIHRDFKKLMPQTPAMLCLLNLNYYDLFIHTKNIGYSPLSNAYKP